MITLVALSTTLFTSCLKDDEKLFPEKSAERITAAMNEAAKMLPTAEYGWLLEQYADQAQKSGGYACCVRFDETTAYVNGEFGKTPETVTKSLWKMTNDNGPTLTLDTYNEIFHYLATPTPSNYRAYQADMEYMVMNVTPDLITLRGKKTGYTMYLRKLTMPAEEYLAKVADLSDRLLLKGVKGNVDGHEVDAVFDIDKRLLTVNSDGEEKDAVPYAVTADGIRLYRDTKITDNISASEMKFTFNPTSGVPESVTFQNAASTQSAEQSLQAYFPQGWQPITKYVGSFTLNCQDFDGNVVEWPVEITADDDGTTLWLSGISPIYDLMLKYSKSHGNISILPQLLYDKTHKDYARAEVNNKQYYLGSTSFAMPKGQTSGYISYTSTVGLCSVDASADGVTRFKLVDNGKWSGRKTTCLRLYLFTSTKLSSTYRNTTSLPNDYRFQYGGIFTSCLYYPEMLTKVE